MKKLAVFLFILFALSLFGCGATKTPQAMGYEKSSHREIKDNDVIISIDLDPVDHTANLIITNHTDLEYSYDYEYFLEIWDDDWYTIPPQVVTLAEMSMVLEPHGVNEESVPLDHYFGVLQSGKYRLVKSFASPDASTVTAVEFDVK